MRRLPITTVVMVIAILAASHPSVTHSALRFERTSILGELELWRVVTGQFVHSSPRLLVVDLLSTGILTWLLERRRGGVAAFGVVLAAALASGLGTLWLRPDIQFLEGASGIASGLFAYLVVELVIGGGPRQRWLAALAATAFVAKLLHESGADGPAAWWMESASETQVVGVAHVAGALAGITCSAFFTVVRGGRWPSLALRSSVRAFGPRPLSSLREGWPRGER